MLDLNSIVLPCLRLRTPKTKFRTTLLFLCITNSTISSLILLRIELIVSVLAPHCSARVAVLSVVNFSSSNGYDKSLRFSSFSTSFSTAFGPGQ